ncbi:COG4705 family protein [Flaviaesturariibacter terrae]
MLENERTAEHVANKVARITLLFWLMKIVATTLGETLGDFLSMTLNLGYTVGIGITLAFFLVVLLVQLRLSRYLPLVYWLVIVGTTTLGTEISDFLDRTWHLGYTWGSLLLASCLSLTLLLWYRRYGNLRVYPISSRGKELYYWVAVLFSNSLGTAFGDFLGDELGLSYGAGALVTGAVILVVVLLHYFTKLHPVLLFWIAFVFTRPFGATFGDFLTKPLAKGGLDLGTLPASLVSVAIMGLLIVLAHRKERSSPLPVSARTA